MNISDKIKDFILSFYNINNIDVNYSKLYDNEFHIEKEHYSLIYFDINLNKFSYYFDNQPVLTTTLDRINREWKVYNRKFKLNKINM